VPRLPGDPGAMGREHGLLSGDQFRVGRGDPRSGDGRDPSDGDRILDGEGGGKFPRYARRPLRREPRRVPPRRLEAVYDGGDPADELEKAAELVNNDLTKYNEANG